MTDECKNKKKKIIEAGVYFIATVILIGITVTILNYEQTALATDNPVIVPLKFFFIIIVFLIAFTYLVNKWGSRIVEICEG